jgi:hypothetical protein
VNITLSLVSGETNIKSPPVFSGAGFSLIEDPIKFVDEFKEAAIWNNWFSNERKKELFARCLRGTAKEWWLNEVVDGANYKTILFENGGL